MGNCGAVTRRSWGFDDVWSDGEYEADNAPVVKPNADYPA